MRHSKSQPLAMILFAVVALLQLPAVAESLRTHLDKLTITCFQDTEILTVKCDSLPHRSIFTNNRCYFAVFEEVEERNATARCSSVLHGAEVAIDVPTPILGKMMVDKSQFELGRDSKFRNFMCAAETGYKCDAQGAIQTSGRCFTRGSRTMNYANANKFCKGLGMEIPAPTNDFDNRIVRDVLVKGPAWVQKSLMEGNGYKWSQVNDYSRWTTCNRDTAAPRLYAGSFNSLLSCRQDTAGAIDQHGYWSKCGVFYVLDVLCVKNADNEFTKGATMSTSTTLATTMTTTTKLTTVATTTTALKKIQCNYHGDPIKLQSVQKLAALPAWTPGDKNVSTTCYTSSLTSTRYNIMAKATVETQRGCEVLCDTKEQCTGFSFKDAGFSSECILLSATTNQICESNIFLKKTVGCAARTDLTAEFGNDPCIDVRVDSALNPLQNGAALCDYIGKKFWHVARKKILNIFRAIDFNGRRISLDQWGKLEKSENSWMFVRTIVNTIVYIHRVVAVTCALPDAVKCPCAPLKQTLSKLYRGPENYPVVPERAFACEGPAHFQWDYPVNVPFARKELIGSLFTRVNPAWNFISTVTCRAGTWYWINESTGGYVRYMLIDSAACQKCFKNQC